MGRRKWLGKLKQSLGYAESEAPVPPAPQAPVAPPPEAPPSVPAEPVVPPSAGSRPAAAASWPVSEVQDEALGGPRPEEVRGDPPPGPTDSDAGRDDGLQTIRIGGADIARLKFPQHFYMLQILDRGGHWREWQRIDQRGLKIGRSNKTTEPNSELNSMAPRHLRLSYNGKSLIAEDLGSLNGVYRKIVEPVELEDGMQFRIGGHVIEFRQAPPEPPAEMLVSEQGEQFWSRELVPLAYLDFIRPDGLPGLRYPLLKANDRVILGRENRPGRPVDITLPYSEVSGNHAQIRHDGRRFFLEDLNSMNGTYVRFQGSIKLKDNDVLLVGRILFRVVVLGG